MTTRMINFAPKLSFEFNIFTFICSYFPVTTYKYLEPDYILRLSLHSNSLIPLCIMYFFPFHYVEI